MEAVSPKNSEQAAATAAPSIAPTQVPAASAAVDRTVTDVMGHEMKIPTSPQHIIAPFLEDALSALGVKPAAQWAANGVPQAYLQTFLKDVPKLSMEGGLKPEEALANNADLIVFVAPTYIKDGAYDSYAKVAPTFVLTKDESDWKGTLKALGELLGKSEAADKALKDYDEKLASVKEKIHAAVGDKTAVILQAGGEKGFKLFGEKFYSGDLVYSGLGFKAPKLLKGDYESYSLETLAQLEDVDYIFVISGEGREKPPVDNPLWKALPAVKNGQVFEVNSGHWFNANAIANGLIMDDIVKAIIK
ncbi:unnamed protein product [Aphanomyces euteiches]